MNTVKNIIIAVVSGFAAFYVTAQGSLNPTGVPAPTMKTLDQVEARTPVTTPGQLLSSSGSYYLTCNLSTSNNQSGVQIYASDVALDLNGFTINGASATSGNGVYINNYVSNVQVFNGTLKDCKGNGIFAANATNCVYRDLVIIGSSPNSSSYNGIRGGFATVVENCYVAESGGDGLSVKEGSRIVNNTVVDNSRDGLDVSGTGSYVAGNTVKGNLHNYNFDAGNQLNILLSEVPETISWPCSVEFSGSLVCTQTGVDGITVSSDGVAINLKGHSLIGPGAGSGNGIYQDSLYKNLKVFNGSITGWSESTKAGVRARGQGTLLNDLQSSENYYGLAMTQGIVSSCTVANNSDDGVYVPERAVVSDCIIEYNGDDGVYIGQGGTVSGCAVSHNGGKGVYVVSGGTVVDCTARFNKEYGIHGGMGVSIAGCSAYGNDGSGFVVGTGSQVRNCTVESNGSKATDAGIYVYDMDNRIDGNNLSYNKLGISVTSTGNIIIRNSASGNSSGNYQIVGGNSVGSITNAPAGAGAWDNFEF